VTRHIEEKRPVDDVFRRERPETGQIGEDRKSLTARLELVVTLDLRMAIAVGGVGKLDRDEGVPTSWGRKSLRMTHW
jgi:hypothetical protein